MAKIASLEELRALRKELKSQVLVREKGERIDELIVISVGMSECGIKAGAKKVMDDLTKKTRELTNVAVLQESCIGDCDNEPIVSVKFPNKESVVYKNVTAEKVDEILQNDILNA